MTKTTVAILHVGAIYTSLYVHAVVAKCDPSHSSCSENDAVLAALVLIPNGATESHGQEVDRSLHSQPLWSQRYIYSLQGANGGRRERLEGGRINSGTMNESLRGMGISRTLQTLSRLGGFRNLLLPTHESRQGELLLPTSFPLITRPHPEQAKPCRNQRVVCRCHFLQERCIFPLLPRLFEILHLSFPIHSVVGDVGSNEVSSAIVWKARKRETICVIMKVGREGCQTMILRGSSNTFKSTGIT